MNSDGKNGARGGFNVDPSEVARFESFASRWWDPDGVLQSLHDINPLRTGYVHSRVDVRGKRVLDAGCGGGVLAEALAALGAHVTGIDAAHAALAAARWHLTRSGLFIGYHKSTIEAWEREDPEPYDLVTCMELLEHVPSPAAVVRGCARLTRSGGDVIFATLNRNPKSFLFAILGAEYLLRLLPIGTHQYRRFVKPSELTGWARENRLEPRDLTGMHYNPFLKRYSLGGNVHVNYLMHFRKI